MAAGARTTAAAAAGGLRIGLRLRRARQERQLSLAEVAARTGLTKGFLSRVERDQASPSVASLLGICRAIGLETADLFRAPATRVVRASERPALAGLPGASVVDTLITPLAERHVTVLESAVAPGGSGGEALYTMPSDCEVCYVVAGSVEVDVEGDRHLLAAGDALTFGAGVPHTWRNSSASTAARILWILAPGLPDALPRA